MGIFSGPSKSEMTTDDFDEAVGDFVKTLGNASGAKLYAELYQSLASIEQAVDENEIGIVLAPIGASLHAAGHGYTPLLMSVGVVDDAVVKRKTSHTIKTLMSPPKGTFLDILGRWATSDIPGVVIHNEATQGAIIQALQYGTADAGTLSGKAVAKLLKTGQFEIYKRAPKMPSYTLLLQNSLVPKMAERIVSSAKLFSATDIHNLQTVMAKPVGGFTQYNEASFASFKQAFKLHA